MADLTERQADAVAALDRALEARLGALDRAFASRRTQFEGRLSDAEGSLTDAIETAVADFKRVASEERRLLHEAAAAQLAALEDAVHQHLRELEEADADTNESLRRLTGRVHELEEATAAQRRDLGARGDGSRTAPGSPI